MEAEEQYQHSCAADCFIKVLHMVSSKQMKVFHDIFIIYV